MKKGFRILKFKKDSVIFEVKDISKSFDGRPILKKLSLNIFESLNKKKIYVPKNLKLRRSIFASKFIKKNEKISEKNIVCLRPEVGIKAKNFYKIIGKRTKKNLKKNDAIYFNDLI